MSRFCTQANEYKKITASPDAVNINIPYRDLTTNKNLIPVNNGIYDTEQDKLLPFSPLYVFTTKIATNYNEKANKSPNIDGWNVDSFIKQLANNDAETELLLWQIIACVINNNRVNEQAFFLYSVKGSTGKGTFQNLLINLVGIKNTATLKLNQFNGTFSLAQLLGKKLVIGDDNKINAYIEDNSNFNSVITHDAVTINQKGQPEFMAIINATVVQSFNGLPKFNNETALRRIKLVMFNNHFTGKHKDPRIKNDYLKRRDVLEYVLYKTSHLKFEQLIEPTSSTQAMKEYMQTANPLRDFKASFFDVVVNELNINKFPTGFLYGWFKRFCEYNNYSIYYSQTQFTQDFKDLLGNNWQYKVIRLNNDEVYKLNNINKQRLTDYSYSENPPEFKKYNAFKRI